MRLYLRPEERRPDLEPVKTDDRKAFATGLALWAVALVVVLVTGGISGSGVGTLVAVCACGIVLGFALLGYAQRRRRQG